MAYFLWSGQEDALAGGAMLQVSCLSGVFSIQGGFTKNSRHPPLCGSTCLSLKAVIKLRHHIQRRNPIYDHTGLF
jgi:hypothetical protein